MTQLIVFFGLLQLAMCTKLILMGAVFRPQQAAGYIVIIGDSEGRTIGALSLWIPLPQTVEEVEVLACC